MGVPAIKPGSPEAKRIVRLRKEEGLDIVVIARRFGLNERTITSVIRREEEFEMGLYTGIEKPVRKQPVYFQDTNGTIWRTWHVTHLAKKFDLRASSLNRVANGRLPHYKGWKLSSENAWIDSFERMEYPDPLPGYEFGTERVG